MSNVQNEKPAAIVPTPVPVGYVVLTTEEYNRLLMAERDVQLLFKLTRRKWGLKTIDIEFNEDCVRRLALSMLHVQYDEETLKQYEIIPMDDFYVATAPLAKPTVVPTDEEA